MITRAHEAGGAFAAGLRALGAEVTEFPVIEIVAPDSYAAIDAALARVASFDWMIFTSASGVERMLERMRTRGVDLRALERHEARRDWPRHRRAPDRACANGCRDAARVSRRGDCRSDRRRAYPRRADLDSARAGRARGIAGDADGGRRARGRRRAGIQDGEAPNAPVERVREWRQAGQSTSSPSPVPAR